MTARTCSDPPLNTIGGGKRGSRFVRLDGRGGTLIPGFVDPHTHLPWAGSREEEFAARLAGKTYQEIAAAGVNMPPKSTYFFPKVPTGLLFNPLTDPE